MRRRAHNVRDIVSQVEMRDEISHSEMYMYNVFVCIGKYIFTERVLNAWNSLPNTVDFNLLAVF